MQDCSEILKNLPPENFTPGGGVYGCRHLLSQYCGFKKTPWQGKLKMSGENWQHGWLPSHYNVHPELALGINGCTWDERESTRFFVARKDQVEYLKQSGYKDVHAIGLPFVYTTDPSVNRIPKSLLVLPVHSTTHTRHNRQSKQYAEYIKSISHHFSMVCISIHPSDLTKGYWVNEFNEQGFPFVTGANFRDSNALDRMRQLFSLFEHVTTNGFGSHLAYASLCGAKVSISGPYEQDKIEDHADSRLKKNSPEALVHFVAATTQESVRTHFGMFFLDPWDAAPREAWARVQLGSENIRTRSETKRLLGWDLKSRMVESLMVRLRRSPNSLRFV